MKLKTLASIILSCFLLVYLLSCKKFIEVDPPRTDLVRSTVFESDKTANAAMLGIYSQTTTPLDFAGGSIASLTFIGGLSSDELINYNPSVEFQQFNDNAVIPTNTRNAALWSNPYLCIYKANAILEGLKKSTAITQNLRLQLEGEAKFFRAFCHFYLVNLFGDVPLVLSTDYNINSSIPKTLKDLVYQQIILDLQDAKNLLPTDFTFANNSRVRATKWAATAMLARVYLYLGEWANAEIQTTEVINNNLFSLTSLNSVFLKNSSEAILQFSRDNGNALDARTFIISGTNPSNSILRPSFVNSFEVNDQRKINWIGIKVSGVNSYNFSYKYKAFATTPINEYTMVIRLAEIFLIRAEARANQNKLVGINSASEDLNTIRNRAGLSNIAFVTQSEILNEVENQRRYELFCEWGHRWLDLKRTGRATVILNPIKSNWSVNDLLYPIPQEQIDNDKLITQNPGY